MSLSRKEVEHVARLARLALTEEEKAHFTEQLGKILDYVAKLREADTADVPPTAHPFASRTAWREDRAAIPASADTEAILKNAPDREESFFRVNKVIE